jgi:hypothetical protein
MDTLTGQTDDACSTKLVVHLERENYATEVVLLNHENALTLTGCAWSLSEDPGLLEYDAMLLALGVPDVSKGHYAFILRVK